MKESVQIPEPEAIRQKMKALGCCVIIPTFNNDGTLKQVIEGVRPYCDDVIVVNDGSTDGTGALLSRLSAGGLLRSCDEAWLPAITVLTIPLNTGKGFALRTGFNHAIEKGFRYAITLDSDGQHFPDDIPKFIGKIEEHPGSIIIGARNMSQEGIPGGSSFGHKFSIFWFRIETGLTIPDVQSGFRLYPLNYIQRIHRFYSTKFEFEVEALVRITWRGAPVHSVPVKVWYAPKGERVSHFRKGRDFARMSLVNAILVFMALLWVRPFLFAKSLKNKSIKGFIREVVLDSKDSNAKIAWSVALGIFIGISPFWGWQSMIVISLAYAFRLNKLISFTAANISIPPNIPWILFMSYLSGGIVLGTDLSNLKYSSGIDFIWIKQNLVQYVVGSFIFGLALATLLGLTTYLLLSIFRRRRPVPEKIRS